MAETRLRMVLLPCEYWKCCGNVGGPFLKFFLEVVISIVSCFANLWGSLFEIFSKGVNKVLGITWWWFWLLILNSQRLLNVSRIQCERLEVVGESHKVFEVTCDFLDAWWILEMFLFVKLWLAYICGLTWTQKMGGIFSKEKASQLCL